MSANHQLSDRPVRSKGQATILARGHPALPATIRDISASLIGVIAAHVVDPGTAVEISIHGHTASGTVQSCQPQGDAFYIGIALAA